MKRWSIALAVLLGVGALTFSLGSPAFAASPAGASPAMTFHLSACPGSGATGNGSVTISQTAKSLTIVEHVRNDLPNAGVFVFLADATTQPPNVFGSFPLNSKGSALFEVHQTTTIPTGVNSGDSIVLALPTGDTTPPVILMASDPANCGV